MRAIGSIALLLVAACGQPATGTGAHMTPAAATVSPPGVQQVVSPPPTVQPAVTSPPAVNFSCRLPVVWSPYQPGASAPANQWGFVVLPGGQLVTQSGPPPQAVQYQLGWPGLSYDRAVSRWLPVSRSAVSSDGLKYAYAEYDPPGPSDGKAVHANSGRIHIVDVRSGADTILYSGSPSFGVVDLETDAVFLTQVGIGYTPSAQGLYSLAIGGGIPRLMPGVNAQTDRYSWTPASEKVWWAVEFAPGVLAGMGSGNELIRYDAAAGAVQTWATATSPAFLEIAGVDLTGRPITVTGPASTQDPNNADFSVSVVTAPGKASSIWDGNAPPGPPSVTDAHGVWMSADQAIWLYGTDGSMLRFPIPVGQTTSPIGVAGACE